MVRREQWNNEWLVIRSSVETWLAPVACPSTTISTIGKKQRKIPKNRKERPSSAAAFLSARVLALQSGASHSEEFRVAYTLTELFLLFCVVPSATRRVAFSASLATSHFLEVDSMKPEVCELQIDPDDTTCLRKVRSRSWNLQRSSSVVFFVRYSLLWFENDVEMD